MTIPLSREEWLATLPQKRSAVGVLFFDAQGRLLILQPVLKLGIYPTGWTLPGGMVDKGESPREAAIRETREEIGLDVTIGRMLCLDYLPTHLDEAGQDSYQMIFDGGVLSDEQIAGIRLQEDEIAACRFVMIDEALTLLRPRLAQRVPLALKARKDGTMIYLENTQRVN